MALIEMDFTSGVGSGLNLDPSTIYKATVNTNSAGTSISVINGKTYLVIFDDDSSVNTTVTGCEVIYKDMSNSCSWGNKYVYIRYLIVKATSDTMSFTNSNSRAFDMTVTQLD